MADDEVRQRYSDIASRYEEIVTGKAGYTAHLRVPPRLLELLNGVQPAKILDLACGTGLSSTLFLESGLDVTGIDIAPGMIEEARKKPFTKLICQSIEEALAIPDEAFDAVVVLGALEFIRSPAALLGEIARKLKGGGLCAITIPQKLPKDSTLTFLSYTQEEVATFIDTSIFEVVEVMEFFGFESGRFAESDPRFTPVHEKIDYWAYFLRKKSC